MKRIALALFIALAISSSALAQQFKPKFKLNIDEPLTSIQAEWIALDRDTLLDVVVTGVAANGQMKLITYQNVNGESLVKKFTQLTGFKNGLMQLADWNGDNKIDLLIAGKTLVNTDALFLFENNGDFTLTKNSSKLLDHASLFRVADLNLDGKSDLITSGTQNASSFLRVYKRTAAGLTQVFDTVGIKVSDINVFDFDKLGQNDFIISGEDVAQRPATLLFASKGDFVFKTYSLPDSVSGKISSVDYDSDGLFDLVATGKDKSNQYVNRIWLNKVDSFSVLKSYPSLPAAEVFTGDMNSDGAPDHLLNGRDALNKRVNFIREQNDNTILLDTAGLITQRMGDFDRDGDLDLLQVMDSVNQQWLKIYEYKSTVVNQRPDVPTDAFAISTFNRTFIFWAAPQDDLTSGLSITYNLWLGTEQATLIPASFDLNTKRRMVVAHGNAGTNNYQIIEGLTDNRYFYQIQSVDNAYNGSYKICNGNVIPCFDLVHKNVQVCKDANVALPSPTKAYWFSLSKGFLGVYDSLKFVASANDTIFSFVPQGADCSKNSVWLIHVNEKSASEKETIYACENKTVKLGIAPGWQTITWNTTPVITGEDTISFVLKKEEVLIASAQNNAGCAYQKEFTVKLSMPSLKLNGETFQILKGNSVQLEATSSASIFKWTPSTGLSSDAISNPVATPLKTIDYLLTVIDSVGCSAEARVQIQVEETAFVPNLFTPNGDGKNDNLLVYGLTEAQSFTFMIYNREGNVVFETTDVQQATSSGWNGAVRGTLQPGGVYYWKVDGRTMSGERLLLNGKKTGTILLVH